ncbi:MAG: 30S ribosomal protein S6 [bacterium]
MQKYETTFIIESQQKSDDVQAIITKVESFIKNHGGNILKKEEWGKKRLAYEINRKQYGYYFHLLFEGSATLPRLLEREYRLEESVLRYLTVKADKRNYPQEKETKTEAPAETTAEAPAAQSTAPDSESEPADSASEEQEQKSEPVAISDEGAATPED